MFLHFRFIFCLIKQTALLSFINVFFMIWKRNDRKIKYLQIIKINIYCYGKKCFMIDPLSAA